MRLAIVQDRDDERRVVARFVLTNWKPRVLVAKLKATFEIQH